MRYSHSSGATQHTFYGDNQSDSHRTSDHTFIRNIRHIQPMLTKLFWLALVHSFALGPIAADVTFVVVCDAWIMFFARSYFWMVRMFYIALVFIYRLVNAVRFVLRSKFSNRNFQSVLAKHRTCVSLNANLK